MTAMDVRRSTGRRGEELARRHLEKLGYRLLDANWTCRLGELDLVFRDKDTVVAVEVRTKRTVRFGSGSESITSAKLEKLKRLVQAYAQSRHWTDIPLRIDVVDIFWPETGEPRLVHVPNVTGL